VKRNEVGSVARKKMLKAWFVMAACGNNLQRPERNMRMYSKYRNEMSYVMHDAQSGEKNSQYGKRWYTNRDTGESKRIKDNKDNKDEKWILGRNWFDNQKLYSLKTKKACYTKVGYEKVQNTLKKKQKEIEIWTKQKWDIYHNSDSTSINNFCKNGNCEVSWVALTTRFKKYIPIYNVLVVQGKTFPPNKDLIGKYEVT